ncbi:MAG: murein L,D-transpeptidase catalytic domain family protein [Fusobacteriaceae bacterium]
MRKNIYFFIFVCMFSNLFSNSENLNFLYSKMKLENKITFETFSNALKGYEKISNKKNDLIVIIDYTKLSTKERFYVLDLKNQKILFESLVSHGKNSGKNMTLSFSNNPNSYKTSLGFFVTGNTYYGDYGYSLRLKGLEEGINSNAESRNIVIHGADYVSKKFILQHGFLGRTLGCPALPLELNSKIIEIIKNGTVLYVVGSDYKYHNKTKFI